MTIGDIETKVRETLLAEHTPDGTYPAYFIVSNIFDGIRMLNSVCPQSRYRGIKLVRDIEFPFLTKNSAASDVTSAESMDFPCDPRWERAVRCFAVSNGNCVVQGFTLTGGHSGVGESIDADTPIMRGGATM